MVISNLALMKGVYAALQLNGVVKSQADFSRRFLMRSKSYLRSMCSRQRTPSKAVMAQLEWSLQQQVISYKNNPHLGQTYAVNLNTAHACLTEQVQRVKMHREQKVALEHAFVANDNTLSSPSSPSAPRFSRDDDNIPAACQSLVVLGTRRL